MFCKSLSLPAKIPRASKIVKSGLPDANHPRIGGKLNQVGQFWLLCGDKSGVGVNPNRYKDVRIRLRKRQHIRIIFQVDAYTK